MAGFLYIFAKTHYTMKRLFSMLALAAIATMALTGCYKQNPVDRNDGRDSRDPDERQEEELAVRERTDWSIRYLGRQDRVFDGGVTEKREAFQISYNGTHDLLPLVIRPGDLQSLYGDSEAEFFTYESDLLLQEAEKAGKSFREMEGVLSYRDTEIDFRRMIHGTWMAYLVELDKYGKPTGDFAVTTFTIAEEKPTEAFSRWIGSWHVADRNSGFDIDVSSADANYLYYVDCWERGPSVLQQMDGERDWIYARFEDDRLVFYAQFLTNDEYEGSAVDQVFAGTYLTTDSDAVGYLDWEGVDYEDAIAKTVETESGYVLDPVTLHFDNGYEVAYHSMRYSRLWFDDEGYANWAFYNSAGVPFFPMAMTPALAPATRASAAPVERYNSKAAVHRYQLKTGSPTRARTLPSR